LGCVGSVGVWGHSLRSTFHRLHLLRLWTPTILLLLFYPFVVPADLSQQPKSAAADGLTYSDSSDKKVWKI
jgi:hypothetical protein